MGKQLEDCEVIDMFRWEYQRACRRNKEGIEKRRRIAEQIEKSPEDSMHFQRGCRKAKACIARIDERIAELKEK